MNNFIKNLLNQPKNIRIGQIWHISEYDNDVIVTDTKFIDEGIVRISIIANEEGDADDVTINPKDVDNGIYAQHKVIIRITDRAIDVSRLKFYKTKINESTVKRMQRSLTNYEFKYDRIAVNYINYLTYMLFKAVKGIK